MSQARHDIHPERGVAIVHDLLDGQYPDALAVVRGHSAEELADRLDAAPDAVFRGPETAALTAPYRRPRMIWGIGLNYRETRGRPVRDRVRRRTVGAPL